MGKQCLDAMVDVAGQLMTMLLDNIDLCMPRQNAMEQLRQMLLKHESLVAIHCNRDLVRFALMLDS